MNELTVVLFGIAFAIVMLAIFGLACIMAKQPASFWFFYWYDAKGTGTIEEVGEFETFTEAWEVHEQFKCMHRKVSSCILKGYVME